jgi:hypothetical protein
MIDYKHRTLEYHFERAGKLFPVLLVTGARQVGKTTFVQHVREEGRTYVTLDDPPEPFLPTPSAVSRRLEAGGTLSLKKTGCPSWKGPESFTCWHPGTPMSPNDWSSRPSSIFWTPACALT